MKKVVSKVIIFALVITSIFSYNIEESKAEVSLSATSAILIEADSGRVLYEQNAFEQLPMASTTKIMTAILAIENCDLDENVVVGENASGVEGSSIWLSVGENMSLSDMLFGLMLASGNDAAVAIAEHVAGSVDDFVIMMNQKAEEIGAYNTHYANPNGLPADDHYTTAYDLALISAYAMQNDYFCEIVKTQYKTITWEGHEWDRVVKNKNKILWNYEGGNGIKTGYTDDAGRCLCSAAERDGMQLIAVVLNAPDMFTDCMSMLDYGFENYSNQLIIESGEYIGDVTVEQGVEESFPVYTQQDVYYPMTDEEYQQLEKRVYVESSIEAPILADQQVGYIDIWLGSNKIYSENLTASYAIGENSYSFNLRKILNRWINNQSLDI